MKLKDFILSRMRISQIYQPVMIKALIENKGRMSVTEIATAILKYDPSQIEYYEDITKNMVGKVLLSHGIVSKEKAEYELNEYFGLSPMDKEEIIELCNRKITDFLTKRGETIWEHRRRNRSPVPGSIRYMVLKRANFRCELCGISAIEKALEVDHITPKNAGGLDSVNNYQALCYTCNSQKSDHDDTDFRNNSKFFDHREKGCIFCEREKRSVKWENNLAAAFFDKFPVSQYHALIIPQRHAKDYFELKQPEINAVNALILEIKEDLSIKDRSITGFNIGINNGVDSGQTVFHCHVHLIPRRKNDISEPEGGIRNLFPGKGRY